MFKGRSFDADMRYWPVVAALKRRYRDQDSVLEVGAGDYGLTPYFKISITAVDIPEAFTESKSDLVLAVETKGVKLPFDSDSFDHVISVDMLEHVSAEERVTSIAEMIRVSRKSVYITVPTGSKSENLDRFLHKAYLQKHGKEYLFLREHVDLLLPKRDGLLEIIKNNSEVKEIWTFGNFNVSLRKWFMLTWMSNNRWLRKTTELMVPLARFYPLLSKGATYRTVFVIDLHEK